MHHVEISTPSTTASENSRNHVRLRHGSPVHYGISVFAIGLCTALLMYYHSSGRDVSHKPCSKLKCHAWQACLGTHWSHSLEGCSWKFSTHRLSVCDLLTPPSNPPSTSGPCQLKWLHWYISGFTTARVSSNRLRKVLQARGLLQGITPEMSCLPRC
jgi:hypothetical protein